MSKIRVHRHVEIEELRTSRTTTHHTNIRHSHGHMCLHTFTHRTIREKLTSAKYKILILLRALPLHAHTRAHARAHTHTHTELDCTCTVLHMLCEHDSEVSKFLNTKYSMHAHTQHTQCYTQNNTHAHTGTQTDLLTYIRDWLDINTPLHLYTNIHTHAHISELFRHMKYVTTCCRYCNCDQTCTIHASY